MSTTSSTVAAVGLALGAALGACSGSEFVGSSPSVAGASGDAAADGGDGGDSATAGGSGGNAPIAGRGGAGMSGSSSGGAPSGGTAGALVGGMFSEGGATAGRGVGAGGEGLGGTISGAAGAPNASGDGGTAGGGGSGGATCAAEDAIVGPPTTFNWPAFSSTVMLDGVEHCASSAGGACSLEVWSFGPTGIEADISCDAEIVEGPCGDEIACGTLGPYLRLSMSFIATATDNGWMTFVDGTTALPVRAGNCTLTASEREGSAEGTLWNAAALLFDCSEWACP